MLEYLRKEVFKLRSQNAQMRNDFDLLKQNNQRLMDANASAGASFAALNQHAKQLTHTNERLLADLNSYKSSVHKLNVVQVELKEELKMKQATYVAEVHSRLQYQKGLAKITDMLQERCRDTRLVEDVLRVAEQCDGGFGDFGSAPSSPARKATGKDSAGSGTLMSTFRSLWS
jgi:predicted nuclease with TOPRIM domain